MAGRDKDFEVQRKMTDKWGEGLMFAMKDREGTKVIKRESKSRDIIEVEISQGKHVWNLLGRVG